MIRSLGNLLALGVLAASLSGCETIYAGKYLWSQGWREGSVLQTRAGAEVPYAKWHRCTKDVPAQELATRRYVQVLYMQGKYRRDWIPLQAGDILPEGAAVLANPFRCELAPTGR